MTFYPEYVGNSLRINMAAIIVFLSHHDLGLLEA